MMELAETLNRTVKLALDQGVASTIGDALALFGGFRLHLHVPPGFSRSPGLEAAVLTLLNAAPRTFLGGVAVSGSLDERCTLAWFSGRSLREVAVGFGVQPADRAHDVPLLVAGPTRLAAAEFALAIECTEGGFRLSPDGAKDSVDAAPVEAGVAAAGAALNEAFQHAYASAPLAGQREVVFELPLLESARSWTSAWTIGLGHLGQAALWTIALGHWSNAMLELRLQDPDVVSTSSLSTCLLVGPADVGAAKTQAVARALSGSRFRCATVSGLLDLQRAPVVGTEEVALVAVDNVGLRRALDKLQGPSIIEAGIGDGSDSFTRVQLHMLPGARLARDIWADGDSRANRAVDISKPAYQAMLATSRDECGTTLLAGRSVATPFVGAFAGALVAWLAKGRPRPGSCAWNFDVNALG
jgi:hypothetical protein